ncbi:MAG TPA: DUF3341 domain-containing protein [Stellaceae bacterium]|jgi:hypothetical protein
MSAAELYGIIASFPTSDAVKEAARQLRAQGIRAVEAYTPCPVEGLDALLPQRRTRLPLLIFLGAVFGAVWGWFIQVWDEMLNFPINVGGRPHNSWPAFVVSTFEFTLLCAVAAGFFGLFVSCRLPRLSHPLFAVPEFDAASRDRFILCVAARDPRFEPHELRHIFERQGAEAVAEVPA